MGAAVGTLWPIWHTFHTISSPVGSPNYAACWRDSVLLYATLVHPFDTLLYRGDFDCAVSQRVCLHVGAGLAHPSHALAPQSASPIRLSVVETNPFTKIHNWPQNSDKLFRRGLNFTFMSGYGLQILQKQRALACRTGIRFDSAFGDGFSWGDRVAKTEPIHSS